MADEPVHDYPEFLPRQTSAVDADEAKRRAEVRAEKESKRKRWFKRQLASAEGREFLWGILQEAGTFEQRFGFGPEGHPNPEGHWYFAGQKDFGQRLYHTWSVLDREGILSLLDEFHPTFPKGK